MISGRNYLDGSSVIAKVTVACGAFLVVSYLYLKIQRLVVSIFPALAQPSEQVLAEQRAWQDQREQQNLKFRADLDRLIAAGKTVKEADLAYEEARVRLEKCISKAKILQDTRDRLERKQMRDRLDQQDIPDRLEQMEMHRKLKKAWRLETIYENRTESPLFAEQK